jgi:hypothetical protein
LSKAHARKKLEACVGLNKNKVIVSLTTDGVGEVGEF